MLNFDSLETGLRKVSSPHFVYDFLRKCFCYNVLIDPISLPDCLSKDSDQYVFCNCLLTRL